MSKDIRNKILAFMREGSYAPMTSEELLRALAESVNANIFWQELLALEENGEIIRTRFDTYGLPEKMGLLAGRLQLTSKGFGFLIPDNREASEDVFIAPSALNGAMNDDRVLVRVNTNTHGKKPEGEILRIITHAHNKVVGVFHSCGDYAFIAPDDKRIGQDIFVMRRDFHNARDGQKVVVEITAWPQQNRKAEGVVTEILGNIGDVGLEILSIIKQNDLPLEFPAEVLAAARKVPKNIESGEVAERRDLRDRCIVTVDGEDAKDLDDAVYVRRLGGSEYLLGVYIADVSYYVAEDGVLDREARERGTSVYLVDRVLPMLPERLSNGICSLNAGEDRLVMACEMRIDGVGKVLAYEIFPAVINVRHRLSYNIVRAILELDAAMCEKYADILDMIGLMNELRAILNQKREQRGAVNFDLPEQKVILDENLRPVEIVQRVHGDAEAIIEEFMLAANETVAQHMAKHRRPFIYRVHEVPDAEKMRDFGKLLANFNMKFKSGEETKPKEIQKALREAAGRPEERLLMTVALRSMKQAVYQTENVGHFGLAAKYYTHFTSPIRRYPDLVVHRLLRSWLEHPRLGAEERQLLTEKLGEIAEHSSARERAAADAERATVELKKCEYMAQHVGEEFDGVISGVTAFGIFVELANGVEGLVHISSLMDDYYEFYEERYALVGMHTGHVYRLGDQVRIEVLRADISEVAIDFMIAGGDDGVREHIKHQLAAKQKGARGYSTERAALSAATKKKKQKAAPRARGSFAKSPSAKRPRAKSASARNGNTKSAGRPAKGKAAPAQRRASGKIGKKPRRS